LSDSRKWKEAWPLLASAVREDALDKFGPFPSLIANDYVHVLKSKGVDDETIKFVKELMRELNWAYDNWARSALSPSDLLNDIQSKVGSLTPGANEFFQIINNYRATHNINA
jgi:hypothetical protein